jgi:hypothetical protein
VPRHVQEIDDVSTVDVLRMNDAVGVQSSVSLRANDCIDALSAID